MEKNATIEDNLVNLETAKKQTVNIPGDREQLLLYLGRSSAGYYQEWPSTEALV